MKIKIQKNTQDLKLKKLRSQYNKYCMVVIGDNVTKADEETFIKYMSRIDEGHILLHYKEDIYLSRLMIDIGIYKSQSEAKGAGWFKKADSGVTDLLLKGARPHRIIILKKNKTEHNYAI